MEIHYLTDNLNFIGKLGNNPLTDNKMSPEKLKSTFDNAGNTIKDFINNKIMRELEYYAGMIAFGTVFIHAGTIAPRGTLLCNGATLDRNTYIDLFEVIGTRFGTTSSTNFKIPNLAAPASGLMYCIVSGVF